MVQRKAQDGKPRTAISILTQLLNYDEMFYENSAFYSCDVRVAWYQSRLVYPCHSNQRRYAEKVSIGFKQERKPFFSVLFFWGGGGGNAHLSLFRTDGRPTRQKQ